MSPVRKTFPGKQRPADLDYKVMLSEAECGRGHLRACIPCLHLERPLQQAAILDAMHLRGQCSQLNQDRGVLLSLATDSPKLGPSVLLLAHKAALSAMDKQIGRSASLASLAGLCSRSGFDVVSS